jgi:hypothetical protein
MSAWAAVRADGKVDPAFTITAAEYACGEVGIYTRGALTRVEKWLRTGYNDENLQTEYLVDIVASIGLSKDKEAQMYQLMGVLKAAIAKAVKEADQI